MEAADRAAAATDASGASVGSERHGHPGSLDGFVKDQADPSELDALVFDFFRPEMKRIR